MYQKKSLLNLQQFYIHFCQALNLKRQVEHPSPQNLYLSKRISEIKRINKNKTSFPVVGTVMV